MNCPRDGFALQQEMMLGASILSCARCSGAWVSGKDVSPLFAALGILVPPLAEEQAHDAPSHSRCPEDSVQFLMSTHQGFMLDFCPACRGIWVDTGELRRLAQGSGRAEEPAAANVQSVLPRLKPASGTVANLTARPVVIALSKKKLVLLILGALAFVVVGAWMWSDAKALTRVMGAVSVLLFGACGLFAIYKLFDSTPGLVIDTDGFTDNSSVVAVGRVEWKDVKGLRITTISGQRCVTVDVSDPEKYIARCGPLVALLARTNLLLVQSPVNISPVALPITFDQLLYTLKMFYERSHRA